ncbi:flagellar biosynthetic protein FliO [Alkalibacterium sp. MB6]|uniref:flagellar biosynthetic protein FliO n=1 Tax=Alkalibacterium sp. MB6 TaxID=2081965 RepID=UPI00137AE5E8|nr:flagellar biosynthetic protein FliO [Alkalibacterium sp. MB6]
MGLPDVLQMLFALAVIIILANYLLKKLNTLSRSSSKLINVIERVPVSKHSSLCIVQVESDYLLMSVSDTSSDVIKTFTQEEKEAIQLKLAKKVDQPILHTDSFLSKTMVNASTLIKEKRKSNTVLPKERKQ